MYSNPPPADFSMIWLLIMVPIGYLIAKKLGGLALLFGIFGIIIFIWALPFIYG